MRKTLGIKVIGFENVEIPIMGLNLNAASFILGMIVSGVLLALAAFPVVHVFSAIMPHHLPVLKRRAKPTEKVS
jgi:hypothetical protein